MAYHAAELFLRHEQAGTDPPFALIACVPTFDVTANGFDNGARRLDHAGAGPRPPHPRPPAKATDCKRSFHPFPQPTPRVNNPVSGLQTGVFTNGLTRAWQGFNELEVGGVIINDVPTHRADHMPYGGVKDSGLGREGLRWAIEDMTELRIMVLAQPG
mgnify:CR=1 FL=1